MQYPNEIMKNKKSVEGAVLGCLFADPLLIKEYKLKSNQFITDEGNLLFGIANELANNNIIEVSDTDIRLICSDDIIKSYKELGGFKSIEKLKRSVDVKNFQGYLDSLYKRNFQMSLVEDGHDLMTEIEIETKKKTIKSTYVDLFKNFNTEQCVNFMQSRIGSKVPVSVEQTVKEHLGGIPDGFIETINEKSDVGVMIDTVEINGESIRLLPYVTKEILGLKKGCMAALASFVNVGKSSLLSNILLSVTSKGNKVLLITNESKIKDIWISMLVYICNNSLKAKQITKKRIKLGKLSDDDKAILLKAQEIYNKEFADKIIVCELADANMDYVEKLTRKYVLSEGIDMLMYDTFKMDFSEGSDVDHKALIQDSRTIDSLGRRYNIATLITIQLAQSYMNNTVLGIDMLSNAKAVNEVLEDMIMMRSVRPEELIKDSKWYITPYQRIHKDGTWVSEEITLDKNGTYRLLFVTKTRNGEVFNDSQKAVVLYYDGSRNTWKELCFAKVKPGMFNQNYTTKK